MLERLRDLGRFSAGGELERRIDVALPLHDRTIAGEIDHPGLDRIDQPRPFDRSHTGRRPVERGQLLGRRERPRGQQPRRLARHERKGGEIVADHDRRLDLRVETALVERKGPDGALLELLLHRGGDLVAGRDRVGLEVAESHDDLVEDLEHVVESVDEQLAVRQRQQDGRLDDRQRPGGLGQVWVEPFRRRLAVEHEADLAVGQRGGELLADRVEQPVPQGRDLLRKSVEVLPVVFVHLLPAVGGQ